MHHARNIPLFKKHCKDGRDACQKFGKLISSKKKKKKNPQWVGHFYDPVNFGCTFRNLSKEIIPFAWSQKHFSTELPQCSLHHPPCLDTPGIIMQNKLNILVFNIYDNPVSYMCMKKKNIFAIAMILSVSMESLVHVYQVYSYTDALCQQLHNIQREYYFLFFFFKIKMLNWEDLWIKSPSTCSTSKARLRTIMKVVSRCQICQIITSRFLPHVPGSLWMRLCIM